LFEIWYQPKVDLKRKCLAGAESIARLRHPELGVLLPGSFIPDVDENAIAELAEYTLLAALNDWVMLDQAGFNLHLAVNVPASVLRKQPIPQLVDTYRPKSARWPGLILEVTEDQLIRSFEHASKIAGQLRASGLTLAIDDFAAASSSFGGLLQLPIAELKIASEFVKNCAVDAASRSMCQSAVDLAHQVGCIAVADGVTNTVDLQAMMVMGCDLAQGPLITPFLPKQEFLDLLRLRNAPTPTAPNDVMQADARPIGLVA